MTGGKGQAMTVLQERRAALATIARGAGYDVAADAVGWKSVATKMEADEGNHDIVAVANTDDVDQDGEVVLPGGANPEPFRRLKSIYLNHDYGSLPIGALRSVKLKADRWVARFHLTTETDMGRDVFALIQDEAINGTSVGFAKVDVGPPTPDEERRYGKVRAVHRRWDWFELSVTPMPCNPAAMIERSATPDRAFLERVDHAVRRGRISRKSAAALGLPDALPSRVVVIPGGSVVRI